MTKTLKLSVHRRNTRPGLHAGATRKTRSPRRNRTNILPIPTCEPDEPSRCPPSPPLPSPPLPLMSCHLISSHLSSLNAATSNTRLTLHRQVVRRRARALGDGRARVQQDWVPRETAAQREPVQDAQQQQHHVHEPCLLLKGVIAAAAAAEKKESREKRKMIDERGRGCGRGHEYVRREEIDKRQQTQPGGKGSR